MGVAIVIIAPFIEEMLFRGYLFDQIRTRANPLAAILSTALLFALVHFSIATLIPIFIMGVIMGVLRERTGSILPSMLFHSLNNLFALVILSMD
jgi:membrane protease YdiL (CAAX protease family)